MAITISEKRKERKCRQICIVFVEKNKRRFKMQSFDKERKCDRMIGRKDPIDDDEPHWKGPP